MMELILISIVLLVNEYTMLRKLENSLVKEKS